MNQSQLDFICENYFILFHKDRDKFAGIIKASPLKNAYEIIRFLDGNIEPISCQELAKEVGLNLNTIHQISRVLNELGLIKKSYQGKIAFVCSRLPYVERLQFQQRIIKKAVKGQSVDSIAKEENVPTKYVQKALEKQAFHNLYRRQQQRDLQLRIKQSVSFILRNVRNGQKTHLLCQEADVDYYAFMHFLKKKKLNLSQVKKMTETEFKNFISQVEKR